MKAYEYDGKPEEEPTEIVKPKAEQNMEVSKPLYTIGIKDVLAEEKEKVKKHIAIEILLEMLFGKGSELYRKLYSEGLLLIEPQLDYEFTSNYAHILITGQSKEPRKVNEEFKKALEKMKQNGIDEEIFTRTKKKIYGRYVTDYNSVADVGRMFLSDYFKGINSFDYLEEYNQVTKEFAEQILKDIFNEEKMVISIVEKK